ncbi:MAG: RecX family transcriptional regulator [Candidatus Izemoplasmatales bacterium]|nr:RecX family transcriptional regulator [Candidatus Izemoplasmatales bacterium]
MNQILERSKRKGNYYVIMLSPNGQKTEYAVSEDMIVEHRLIEGKILDDFAFSAFIKAHAIDTIYQRIVKSIVRKPKTTHEIKEELRESALSLTVQDQIIKKLKSRFLLDDDRLTQSIVDYQMDVLGTGPKKIEFDLQKRGIHPDLISKYLSQIEDDVILRHLEKLWKNVLNKTTKQPLMRTLEVAKRYFYDKGYSDNQVKRFLSAKSHELKDQKDDGLLLKQEYQKQQAKLQKESLDPFQYKRKLVSRLLQKGYRYEDILSIIEGGFVDELSDV